MIVFSYRQILNNKTKMDNKLGPVKDKYKKVMESKIAVTTKSYIDIAMMKKQDEKSLNTSMLITYNNYSSY